MVTHDMSLQESAKIVNLVNSSPTRESSPRPPCLGGSSTTRSCAYILFPSSLVQIEEREPTEWSACDRESAVTCAGRQFGAASNGSIVSRSLQVPSAWASNV